MRSIKVLLVTICTFMGIRRCIQKDKITTTLTKLALYLHTIGFLKKVWAKQTKLRPFLNEFCPKVILALWPKILLWATKNYHNFRCAFEVFKHILPLSKCEFVLSIVKQHDICIFIVFFQTLMYFLKLTKVQLIICS